jgi:uncharacterized membrane protein YadS
VEVERLWLDGGEIEKARCRSRRAKSWIDVLPSSVSSLMSAAASFGIVMVLASVGLNVDLLELARIGPKALVVGLIWGL